MKDSNGYITHEVMLTKLHINMGDEDFEISAWSHLGIILSRILHEYVGEVVGFAQVEASSWTGRTMSKTNLIFGADAKLKLPEKEARPARHKAANLKIVPTTLSEIAGFEGKAQRMWLG